MPNSLEIRGPDGQMFRFPDGTDEAIVEGALRQHYSSQPAPLEITVRPSSTPQSGSAAQSLSIPQRATNFFQHAGSMVPFADEIRSAGYAAQDIATGGEIEGSWARGRARDDAAAQFAEENISGLERVAADTFGLAASVLAPTAIFRGVNAAAGAPEATRSAIGSLAQRLGLTGQSSIPASAAGRIAQATAIGAGSGTVMGASEGRSTEDRIENANIGALGGAVMGTLGAGAAEGASSLLRGASRLLPGRAGPHATQRATERIASRLSHDDISPDQAVQRVREMQRSGVDGALLDAGPSTRTLARSIRNQPGPSAARLEDFAEHRGHDIPRAVRSRIDDAFMVDDTGLIAAGDDLRMLMPGVETENFLRQRISRQTGPMYRAITDQIPTSNQTLRAVLQSPSGRAAITDASQAVGDLRAAGRIDYDFPAIFNDAGEVAVDSVDIRILHQIRQSLDSMSDFNSPSTQNNRGPQALRRALDDIMKEASPALATADVTHRFLMDGFDGIQIGQNFDRVSTQQLESWMADATPVQRFMARLQAANKFGGRIQNMSDPTTQARPGGARLASLRVLFGTEEAADDFVRHIEAQRQVAQSRQAVMGGSTTAQQQANIGFEDAALVAELGADLATTGGIAAMMRTSANRIARMLPGSMSAAERTAIIDILTETDPQRLSAIFESLEGVTQGTLNSRTTRGIMQNAGTAAATMSAASQQEQP